MHGALGKRRSSDAACSIRDTEVHCYIVMVVIICCAGTVYVDRLHLGWGSIVATAFAWSISMHYSSNCAYRGS